MRPPLLLPAAKIAGPRASLRQAALLISVLPYAATAAAVLAVGLPTIILPFWSDNAIFATIGQRISHGGFPYVDAWDQKPPAIYFIYAVAIHGPFGLFRNVRLFDLGWTALTSIALVELGRRWWSMRAGVIAGVLYGVVYLTASTWTQLAQPDSFIGLPLVLALILLQAARGRPLFLLTAGLLLGFAFELRAIMAPLVPFFPLPEVAAAPAGTRLRLWLRTMLWLISGFAVLQAALALYLAAGGALGEFIAASRFAAGYTRIGGPWQGPDGPTFKDFLQTLRLSFVYWALVRLVVTAPAVAGGLYGALIARERRVQQLVLFVVLAYAGIAAQAKFFWYHYWYMLVFLSLLAGWAWDRMLGRLFRAQPRPIAWVASALVAAGLLLSTPDVLDNGWDQWRDYLRYQRDPAAREPFFNQFGGFWASRETAWYVRQRTQPGETVYVWGYDPLIYLLSDRPYASRFIYALPMMSDWAPPSWREEFIAQMKLEPPAYFITQHHQGGPWITGHSIDPADYIVWIPELQTWLRQNYRQETTIGDFVIYRRR